MYINYVPNLYTSYALEFSKVLVKVDLTIKGKP